MNNLAAAWFRVADALDLPPAQNTQTVFPTLLPTTLQAEPGNGFRDRPFLEGTDHLLVHKLPALIEELPFPGVLRTPESLLAKYHGRDA